MFINVNGLHMEPPSEAQRKAIEQVMYPCTCAFQPQSAFELCAKPITSV